MGKKWLLGTGLMMSILTYRPVFAQEEESAEVYLEEYTDEFQENFFEALKQKGIQNYDRTIALLLKCKQLEPSLSVVDYELAKAYYAEKQYINAQDHAIDALNLKPADFWYLENLLTILDAQGNSMDAMKENIPFKNQKLQENLAVIYFKKRKYDKALETIKRLDNQELALELKEKINDSLNQKKSVSQPVIVESREIDLENNPITNYKQQMEAFIENKQFNQLFTISKEALDTYPLQPFFYYAYGAALNRTSNPNKAIQVLESGLDYLLDDNALANRMYAELANAYTQIGNTSKANEYSSKIKSGI